jgi:hypothetical protein
MNAWSPEHSWESLAVDAGDRYSDLDLTFAAADDAEVAVVLDDWARTLIEEDEAVHLVDLRRGPTTYRVFLLPGALQLDLSMTPAAEFRPAGPRFKLLFGGTSEGLDSQMQPAVGDLFIASILPSAAKGEPEVEQPRPGNPDSLPIKVASAPTTQPMDQRGSSLSRVGTDMQKAAHFP